MSDSDMVRKEEEAVVKLICVHKANAFYLLILYNTLG